MEILASLGLVTIMFGIGYAATRVVLLVDKVNDELQRVGWRAEDYMELNNRLCVIECQLEAMLEEEEPAA